MNKLYSIPAPSLVVPGLNLSAKRVIGKLGNFSLSTVATLRPVTPAPITATFTTIVIS